ncbi:MAG: type II secretion system F family protein [Candidatus Saccharibacteria bacterium]|nr:type II secretion system F family protein [Candidatus Saccharibacteria bacterium]
MRRFDYTAKDSKTGKTVKGKIQADSEQAAGKLLIEQGYSPQKIQDEDAAGGFFKFLNKATKKDQIMFTRQFATLIGAGLPLSTSLRTVMEQTESKPMQAIIDEVIADVEAGRKLTDALKKYPETFDRVYIALVEAGETSGTLDVALKRLADQQEKEMAIASKIKSAMTSPLITLVVIIAVVIFMLLEVVPQVEDLYESLKKDLPFATQILVSAANFMMNQWIVVVVMLAVTVWFFMWFRRTDAGIRILAGLKLNAPIFKSLFQMQYMARFGKTMENLLSTGVSMLDSMQISGESMDNIILQEQIEKAEEGVRAGKSLSSQLKEADYMLPLIPQMAAVGEESGKIDEMLGKAAKVYEDQVDEQVARISQMIEPIMMLMMAVLAGGIIMAVLFPIYSLVGSV